MCRLQNTSWKSMAFVISHISWNAALFEQQQPKPMPTKYKKSQFLERARVPSEATLSTRNPVVVSCKILWFFCFRPFFARLSFGSIFPPWPAFPPSAAGRFHPWSDDLSCVFFLPCLGFPCLWWLFFVDFFLVSSGDSLWKRQSWTTINKKVFLSPLNTCPIKVLQVWLNSLVTLCYHSIQEQRQFYQIKKHVFEWCIICQYQNHTAWSSFSPTHFTKMHQKTRDSE